MKRVLKNVLFLAVFCLIAVLVMNSLYKQIGYGYFKKALSRPGVTFFTRDNKVKYSKMNSYKIENKEYNNATFYKKVKVKRNTPYRVTCMIKTENVDVMDRTIKNSGAHITLLNSKNQSECLTGTHDWTKVSLLFNSEQNDEVSVGFMLGAEVDYGNVSGTAWFSDLKLEEGTVGDDTSWNVVCFIFKNIDMKFSDKRYEYSMYEDDVVQLKDCISRFQKSCDKLSDGKLRVTCDIVEIDSPITSLSYDEKKGYYIDSKDVDDIIKPYINSGNYNHIFACARMNDNKTAIRCDNWIGLGSMEYRGIGFSNVRMPTNIYSNKFIYDEEKNRFPEEVFVHEFLHTLEKNSKKYGYSVPSLHDYEKYGYESNEKDGLYGWFKDYMKSSIGEKNEGINEQVYRLKPVDESNFKDSKYIDEFEDVTNIFERLKLVVKTMNTYKLN